MAELKTKPTKVSVKKFLDGINDDQRREDCFALVELMKKTTKAEPVMWGPSIVGFGDYHYKYESGREGDWFLVGFSPRKQDLTLYLMGGFAQSGDLMKLLGKYKTGKGCLYIRRLSDIHLPTLRKLVSRSVKEMAKRTA
jgi:hypothetical protein